MSALDVVPIPGHPGMYARRVFVEAWQAAGSPPINSAGRLYAKQKEFYDGWVNRLPGFNPADNPDDESQRLAHVRFVAGDIDPTPDRIRRLEAAGLVRPYSYEPWHWELPNVRQYAIVRFIPTAAGGGNTPPITESEEDDDMPRNSGFIYRGTTQKTDQRTVLICNYGSGLFHEYTNGIGAADSAYNAAIAKAFDTTSFAEISASHAESIKKSLRA